MPGRQHVSVVVHVAPLFDDQTRSADEEVWPCLVADVEDLLDVSVRHMLPELTFDVAGVQISIARSGVII